MRTFFRLPEEVSMKLLWLLLLIPALAFGQIIGRSSFFVPSGAAAPAASSLLTGITAYWKMEEASGTRYDETDANNDLGDQNTVTQSASGKIGNCAQFTAANSEYLNIAAPGLIYGDNDWTVAGWFQITDNTAAHYMWSDGTGAYIRQSGFSHVPTIYIDSDGSPTEAEIASDSAMANNTWYLIIGWHDKATNRVYIQLNNGGIDSSDAYGGSPTSPYAEFRIGVRAAEYLDGLADEVGVWSRVLTATERTTLYNSGSGKQYPFAP